MSNVIAPKQHSMWAQEHCADPTLDAGILKESDKRGTLDKRFGVSPFSVLNARAGNWQERKRQWISLGLKGEEGRHNVDTANAICAGAWNRGAKSEFYEPSKVEMVPGGGGPNSIRRRAAGDVGNIYKRGNADGADGQHGLLNMSDSSMRIAGGYHDEDGQPKGTAGTSIFDPVLCEMAYKWFCPPNGHILDPFAGGPTRGVVAARLGYNYTGIDIRPDQVDADIRQAAAFQARIKAEYHEDIPLPNYYLGDSTNLSAILDDNDPFTEFDFIWTCPPYYNLEIYSETDGDGSAFESYPIFMDWYRKIFAQAAARLKPNRFAAVVVGEVRSEELGLGTGYLNFERDNMDVFEELGFIHYNRIVLVTAVGSLPVRIANKFQKNRKVGNTHQMIYVFWKGNGAELKRVHEHLGIMEKGDVIDEETLGQ